jgi:hypothetical protein
MAWLLLDRAPMSWFFERTPRSKCLFFCVGTLITAACGGTIGHESAGAGGAAPEDAGPDSTVPEANETESGRDAAPESMQEPEAGDVADAMAECDWEGSYGDPMRRPLDCDQVERAFSVTAQWTPLDIRLLVTWCECSAFCSWYGDVLEIESMPESGWETPGDCESAWRLQLVRGGPGCGVITREAPNSGACA